MADIAAVFHWTRTEMDGYGITELMHWRELARVRSGNE